MIKVNFDYTDELLILNKILNNNGSEDNLRIVGGAIRNFLINKNINDYDLSCKFLPEQNIKILEYVIRLEHDHICKGYKRK